MPYKHIILVFIGMGILASVNAQTSRDDFMYYLEYMGYLTDYPENEDTTDLRLRSGFMNKRGKVIIEPQEYTKILNFRNGIANVVLNSTYGYIDEENNRKLFPQFHKAYWNGKFGMAEDENKKSALIDMSGKLITGYTYDLMKHISPQSDFIMVKKNDSINFIDTEGRVVFHDSIRLTEMGIFHSVAAYEGRNGKLGLIHKDGYKVTPPEYDHLYGEYFAPTWVAGKNDKYGLINCDGEIVVPIKYNKINYVVCDGDPVPVKKGDKFGYVLGTEIIIPFEYEEALPFIDGRARVKKDGLHHFINKRNKILASFKHDGGWNGKNYVSTFRVRFRQNKKFGYLNKRGQLKIDPVFDYAFSFKEGIARVGINGHWGFIDMFGNPVIPIKFFYLSDINEGKILFVEEFE